ncbi:MAG: acyl-CoA dehydrogenase, partial [Bacillus sp. (in: firmicutes)]|nr:acyl-CoA dehydrogenase [Bacillus sp. (in: firmicutes)]
MGHILTEEQIDLRDLVREFALKELKPYVKEFDESGEFPLEILQKAFEMGLHVLEIPEEYGGSGLDFKTTAIVFEELAKVDAGFAISLVTTFV